MGVLVAFILLVVLIYKKFPITVAAIICAGVMALLSGMDVMETLTGDYMAATVAFIKNYFILFLVSAIFGRIMDTSGAAYSIGKWLGSKLGAKYAIWGVSFAACVLTYGGVSRYTEELGLSAYDANQLTATKALSDFFERAVALGGDAKQVSNWLQGEVAQFLNAEGKTIEEISLIPENLVEMIAIIEDGTISSKIAKKVFVHLAKEGGSARAYVEKAGLVQISDPAVLIPIIHQVFAENEATPRVFG